MPARLLKILLPSTTKFYNALLILLALLFIFRPFNESYIYLGIWRLMLTCVFVLAVLNIDHRHFIRRAAIILAFPPVILSWIEIAHHMEVLFVINALLTFIFIVLCASAIVYDVLRSSVVTFDLIRGTICAYFMVAFAFAYLFYLVDYMVPGSFTLTNHDITAFDYTQYISDMMYFSFTTLTCLGMGDIAPSKHLAETLVAIEGVVGNFYIAILVSRLVAIYALPAKKGLKEIIAKHD